MTTLWVPTATTVHTNTYTGTRVEQVWTTTPPYEWETTFPITWTATETQTLYKPVPTNVPRENDERRHARGVRGGHGSALEVLVVGAGGALAAAHDVVHDRLAGVVDLVLGERILAMKAQFLPSRRRLAHCRSSSSLHATLLFAPSDPPSQSA